MSKTDPHSVDFLSSVFTDTSPSWASITDFYISLHTADPGESGDPTTNEASYTGYARVAVPRDGLSWAITGTTVSNLTVIEFPISTGGPQPAVTHVGIGRSLSGTTGLLYVATLNRTITIQTGTKVTFNAGAITFTED